MTFGARAALFGTTSKKVFDDVRSNTQGVTHKYLK